MTKKAIYLHGYNGSGGKHRVTQLGTLGMDGISQKYDNHVDMFNDLSELLMTDRMNYVLVGVSMGGYVASLLHRIYAVPAIVCNPVCDIRMMRKKYDSFDPTWEAFFLEMENSLDERKDLSLMTCDTIIAFSGKYDESVKTVEVKTKFSHCTIIDEAHQIPDLSIYLCSDEIRHYVESLRFGDLKASIP